MVQNKRKTTLNLKILVAIPPWFQWYVTVLENGKAMGKELVRLIFGVENLIFPRPFLLGTSLRADFYWEIGVKPIALKRIKAFVSKMYLFL